MPELWLAWSYAGSLQIALAAMKSWVQCCPRRVQKAASHSAPPHSSIFYLLVIVVSQWGLPSLLIIGIWFLSFEIIMNRVVLTTLDKSVCEINWSGISDYTTVIKTHFMRKWHFSKIIVQFNTMAWRLNFSSSISSPKCNTIGLHLAYFSDYKEAWCCSFKLHLMLNTFSCVY